MPAQSRPPPADRRMGAFVVLPAEDEAMRKPIVAVSDEQILNFLPDAPENAQSKQCFRIENAAKDKAILEIYDVIWPWEPKRLMAELRETNAKTIHLRINSPGGDAFAGVALYNALVRHEARVLVDIDGVAASAASLAAMAGDEIRMGTGSKMMIHQARVLAIGTSSDLRDTAEVLDKVDEGIADIYAERTGKPLPAIHAMLAKETWMTADEAIEHGFADEKTGRKSKAGARNITTTNAFAAILTEALGARPAQSEPDIGTIRDLETHLRDVGGFSNAAAKKIAAGGFAALTGPRDEDDEGSATPVNDVADEDLAALSAALLSMRLSVSAPAA